METILLAAALVAGTFALSLGWHLARWHEARRDELAGLIGQPLLSTAERALLARLQEAFPECAVLPQRISLWKSPFRRSAWQAGATVDFLVVDRDMTVRAALHVDPPTSATSGGKGTARLTPGVLHLPGIEGAFPSAEELRAVLRA